MNGVFWLVWFCASAGFAKLLATTENTIHGIAWPRPRLQRVRTVHNILLFSYPLFLVLSLGVFGPQLLWHNDWSRLPWWGSLALILGFIGLLRLIASTIRYLTYQPPACQTNNHTRLIDWSSEARQFTGSGRARWVAQLPWNQQFSLEISEKTLDLPRLPAAWEGISIVHFSDCHFRGSVTREYFERVMAEIQGLQGDLIAFTGDLLDHHRCLAWIPETLGRLSAPLGCYFVLGNHDWYVGLEQEIRQQLTACGWIDIAGKVVLLERENVPLAVCGSERPWLGHDPDLSPLSPDLFRLLLSHGPDQITWAQAHSVDLMLAGHTHGGQIRLPVLGPVYSPSLHDCRYASGVFQQGSTVMSVSRGVSGREPVRYNCRPEITKITIRNAR